MAFVICVHLMGVLNLLSSVSHTNTASFIFSGFSFFKVEKELKKKTRSEAMYFLYAFISSLVFWSTQHSVQDSKNVNFFTRISLVPHNLK